MKFSINVDINVTKKVYLLDKLIGIDSKQRLLNNVQEKLIENAIESSYEYSGEHAAYGVKISRQEESTF